MRPCAPLSLFSVEGNTPVSKLEHGYPLRHEGKQHCPRLECVNFGKGGHSPPFPSYTREDENVACTHPL